jgi:hypothetical protein
MLMLGIREGDRRRLACDPMQPPQRAPGQGGLGTEIWLVVSLSHCLDLEGEWIQTKKNRVGGDCQVKDGISHDGGVRTWAEW